MLYLTCGLIFAGVAYLISAYVNYNDGVESSMDDVLIVLWMSILWPLYLVAIPLGLLGIGWLLVGEKLPDFKKSNSFLNEIVWPYVESKIKLGCQKCKETVSSVVTSLKGLLSSWMGK